MEEIDSVTFEEKNIRHFLKTSVKLKKKRNADFLLF